MGGRGLILLQLIPEFGLPKGCDLNLMMDNLIKPQLLHKNGDVRDIGMQITGLLYQVQELRNRVCSYLDGAGFNDFLKESLNNTFEEVSGNGNVLTRESKSIKEQSRPSRTMNRTSNQPKKRKPQRKQQQQKKKQREQVQTKQQYQQQQEIDVDEEDDDEQEDVCNFCGLRDPAFLENEENLDLHYWQSCPMLTSCKLCEQVIEIATLHEHIQTECESGIKHQSCGRCGVPIPVQEMNSHHASGQCKPMSAAMKSGKMTKCPLCLVEIPV